MIYHGVRAAVVSTVSRCCLRMWLFTSVPAFEVCVCLEMPFVWAHGWPMHARTPRNDGPIRDAEDSACSAGVQSANSRGPRPSYALTYIMAWCLANFTLLLVQSFQYALPCLLQTVPRATTADSSLPILHPKLSYNSCIKFLAELGPLY